MNYIKEINAFYDRQEQSPLSGAAVALWYALMHINNKTRWKNTFTSPSSVLRNKAGLDLSSFKRARTQLEKQGYIEVVSQGKGLAPIYKMCSLLVEMEVENQPGDELVHQPPTQQVDQVPTHLPTQPADQLPSHDPAPLYKQYINQTNIKQNNPNTSAADAGANTVIDQDSQKADAIVFYQENFGMVSPFVSESLLDWTRTMGEELVIEAMKRALERDKKSWGYVKSILTAWDKKGIRTLSKVRAEQVAFENERRQKSASRGGFNGGKREIVPEWFEEEKQKQKERREQKEREEQATPEQLEAVMRRYLEGSAG